MGGNTTKKTEQSTSTQSNAIDPAQLEMLKANYATAQGNATKLATPYTGEMVSPFSPTQVAGQRGILSVANNNVGADALSQAKAATAGILNYKPAAISSPGTMAPRSVTAGQLSNTDLAPYLNPYMSDVVSSTLADLQHARDQQQVRDNQTATAEHAFGGSRAAVRDAMSTDDYLRNLAGTTANLRSGAYTNAQTAALSDINNRMNADTFNANAGMSADQFNLNNLLDIAKMNSANDITGAGLRLNAGSQLSGMSDQELQQALQRAGVVEGVGQEQTAQTQAQDTAAYQEFLRQMGIPVEQQQVLNSSLGLIPVQQTVNSTGSGTSTQKVNPGILGILGQGIGMASNAFAL